MSMKENKERKFPLPTDGGYASREESGDFRKIEEEDDYEDDTDDVNFMDMPPQIEEGDENYDDEEMERSRKDYRDKDMRENTDL